MQEISPMERVRRVCADLELNMSEDLIFVDIEKQTLAFYKKSEPMMNCAVSTSRFGIGNRENSYMTPLGLHYVEEKIGDGATPGTIFRSRENTGVIWTEGMEGENQMLSRILRLRGLEPGLNVGPGIDSYDRYIYIHGTNREDMLGKPASHGCVCMGNNDVIRLFDMAAEGTFVYIQGTESNIEAPAE
ncbi:MAG: L,D-transpeptidase [Chitinispirillales bacterium]|jgi:UDP-N-acetylmuramate--alanine ligase|nr:L,D-transpeptidase [Chitinispirillales bacterium]